MHLPRYGQNRAIDFNVTPLIDVVFLLIIFFLVSSHLARQETQIELALPTAETGLEPSVSEVPRVTVNVLADGRLQLGSELIVPGQLVRRLDVERTQAGDDLEVRIRSDRNVAYRVVEPVLLSCAEARIWNVSFAVNEKK